MEMKIVTWIRRYSTVFSLNTSLRASGHRYSFSSNIMTVTTTVVRDPQLSHRQMQKTISKVSPHVIFEMSIHVDRRHVRFPTPTQH